MKNACYILLAFFLVTSCQFFETEKISSETFYEEELKTINWKDVDQYPVFAECEHLSEKAAQKTCFEGALASQIYNYISAKKLVALRDINDTVSLAFRIDTLASLTVTKIEMDSILKREFPNMEQWIYESIDSVSLVAPAFKRGIPVKTEFTLPIVIKTQAL